MRQLRACMADFEQEALRRRIVELLAEHGVEVVDVAKRVG